MSEARAIPNIVTWLISNFEVTKSLCIKKGYIVQKELMKLLQKKNDFGFFFKHAC